jgi:hypothetical protein
MSSAIRLPFLIHSPISSNEELRSSRKRKPNFTRLDLRADSTGFCARVSPADTNLHDQGVHSYRITRWDVSGWNIEIHMSPLSNATGVSTVNGRIGLASLRLTIGGPENGGWKEEPFLNPEHRIMVSNKETSDRIEAAEKN